MVHATVPKPWQFPVSLGEGSLKQDILEEARRALEVLNQYFDDSSESSSSALRGDPVSLSVRQKRELARSHLRSGLLRKEVLGAELSSEYCWMILMALYLSRCDASRMCVTDIVYSTGIPAATVIRWLTLLSSRGLVFRSPDRNDARRTWIVLDDTAVTLIEKCLTIEASEKLQGKAAKS